MAASDNLGEQFGMSRREQAEITGKAVAGHLWEGMEGIFGNMKVAHQSSVYDELSTRFGTDNVTIPSGEDNDPYVEVQHGPHSLRYHGGATLNYYTDGENVDASTTYEHGEMHHEDLQQRLRDWVDYAHGE